MFARICFFLVGVSLLCNTEVALAKAIAKPMPAFPAISMRHITLQNTLQLRPDRPDGSFSGQQNDLLSKFLRCHYTNKRKPMDLRLFRILYNTARHFRNASIQVVSGYRAPSVAKRKGNPRSPHQKGIACDFTLVGVSNEALRDYLRATYSHIGVGYYPHSGFVHLDVGRAKPAFWVDLSRPGQRARYAANPETFLHKKRARG